MKSGDINWIILSCFTWCFHGLQSLAPAAPSGDENRHQNVGTEGSPTASLLPTTLLPTRDVLFSAAPSNLLIPAVSSSQSSFQSTSSPRKPQTDMWRRPSRPQTHRSLSPVFSPRQKQNSSEASSNTTREQSLQRVHQLNKDRIKDTQGAVMATRARLLHTLLTPSVSRQAPTDTTKAAPSVSTTTPEYDDDDDYDYNSSYPYYQQQYYDDGYDGYSDESYDSYVEREPDPSNVTDEDILAAYKDSYAKHGADSAGGSFVPDDAIWIKHMEGAVGHSETGIHHSFYDDNGLGLTVLYTWLGLTIVIIFLGYIIFKKKEQLGHLVIRVRHALRSRPAPTDEDHQLLQNLSHPSTSGASNA